MKEVIVAKENNLKNNLLEWFRKDIVLIVAVGLAVISSMFSKPKFAYIDFKVLILLFNLMTVVAVFKELRVLDYIAINILKKCNSYRSINLALVYITFIAAMFVTNDVALITFVPLTLIVAQKTKCNVMKTIVFQTLAANLGSSLTPMGNPQNLYIYTFYNLKIIEFIMMMAPIVLVSVVILTGFIIRDRQSILEIDMDAVNLGNSKQIIFFSLLFIIILLSVFHLLDYRLVFLITLLGVLSANKKLLRKVDYGLLITFIGFFIFIGNLSAMESVRNFMQNLLATGKDTFWSALLTSQVISNVPATMLLAGFTPYHKELLLGVNIGGMGTLIASLASVIAYKQYVTQYPRQGKDYIKSFTRYNIVALIILVTITYVVLL